MNEFLGWAHTLATAFRFARPWWLLWTRSPPFGFRPLTPFPSNRVAAPKSLRRAMKRFRLSEQPCGAMLSATIAVRCGNAR